MPSSHIKRLLIKCLKSKTHQMEKKLTKISKADGQDSLSAARISPPCFSLDRISKFIREQEKMSKQRHFFGLAQFSQKEKA